MRRSLLYRLLMSLSFLHLFLHTYGQHTERALSVDNAEYISTINADTSSNIKSLINQSANYKVFLLLKSNLLFTCAGILNMEAEVPVDKRWSVNTELQFSCWVNKRHNTFAFQFLSAGVEGRYWFLRQKDRRLLTGHFIGLYANVGSYDFQFDKSKGYQGELWVPVGVSYGYVIPLNKRLALEFSLGIGYMITDYRHYRVVENGSILAQEYRGKHQWLGPTKAKITLSWLWGRKIKKKNEQ